MNFINKSPLKLKELICYTHNVRLEKGDNMNKKKKMKKLFKIVKIIVAVFVLLGITTFSMLSYASSKTENEYRLIHQNIDNGNYTEALRIAESIPHYKNSSELYAYLYPHKLFTDNYNTYSEKLQGYRKALEHIAASRDRLKESGAENYIKDLGELEKTLSFKIEEIEVVIENESAKAALKDGATLITQGDLPKAQEKLGSIGEGSIFAKDKHQLLNYINLINAVNGNDEKEITRIINLLNPNYNGELCEDIKAMALSKVSVEKWNEGYLKKIEGTHQEPFIKIGMTKEEIIPLFENLESITRIENRYGNFEKIKAGNRVVYFEGNTVIGIK